MEHGDGVQGQLEVLVLFNNYFLAHLSNFTCNYFNLYIIY